MSNIRGSNPALKVFPRVVEAMKTNTEGYRGFIEAGDTGLLRNYVSNLAKNLGGKATRGGPGETPYSEDYDEAASDIGTACGIPSVTDPDDQQRRWNTLRTALHDADY